MSKDLISRQDAIDALISEGRSVDSRYISAERIIHESDAIEAISMLPSAQPKTAVWVGEGDGYVDGIIILDTWYCSNCDYLYDYEEKPNWKYCPNCGAEIQKGDNE